MHQTWRGHGLASGKELVHFGGRSSVLRRATQVMRGCYRAEMEPLQLGIRPGTGRAVFLGGVNSGSPWRPLLLFPRAAQGELRATGASPFTVAA